MKILYVHTADVMTLGAHLSQVVSMCNAHRLNGHQVNLILWKKWNITEEAAINRMNVLFELDKEVNLEFKDYYVSIKIVKWLCWLRHYSYKRYDCIFIRNVLLLPILKTRTKCFLETHNVKLHHKSAIINEFLISNLRIRLYLSNSNLVCISNSMRKFYEQRIQRLESEIIVAHDGFNELNYRGNDANKHTLREKWNMADDRISLVYTGTLAENRRIDELFDLLNVNDSIDLYLAGGNSEEIERLKSIAPCDRVKFVGFLAKSEVAELQCAADILLAKWSEDVPTINTSSPLKIFEYMAAGGLIVSDSYVSIQEILENRRNAILLGSNTLKERYDAIQEVLTNLDSYSYLGRNAKKEVHEKYTWRKRAEYILNS